MLSALVSNGSITVEKALNIPTVAGCIEIISNTVAMLPILLYREQDGKTQKIEDNRIKLLNDDTKDTLDAFQFKKTIVEDYLIHGVGYAYINRQRNKVKSIHYVEKQSVSVNVNFDKIFKKYDILVDGKIYRDFEFLKITRKTKNGVTGTGILKENSLMLSLAYNSLVFEDILVKTGGNRKGFIKAENKLSPEAVDILKKAWANLYKGDSTENVVVLNQGMDFKESSQSSVEMQLNENKKTNSVEVCKIFNVPPSMLEGGKTSKEEYNNFIKLAILPILKAFTTALNKDLLLESEKGSFYFAFDTKELLKGELLERFKAYEIAIKNGFMQFDEVRYIEDLEAYGLDWIKLGLQDVLYNPKTKEIYTPNTDKKANMSMKGGDSIEDRDKSR